MDKEKQQIPRMLSIPQVVETGVLTRNAIRTGIAEGWIPYIRIGKKYLVNFDKLIEILEAC